MAIHRKILRTSTITLQMIMVMLLGNAALHGQQQLGITWHRGSVMKHAPSVAHLHQQMPGVEMFYQWKVSGQKKWHTSFPNLQRRVAVHYFWYDPDKPLGNTMSIIYYGGQSLSLSKNISLGYRLGAGPGFVSRFYHPEDNPRNSMISNFLNYTLGGHLDIRWHWHPRWSFSTGMGIVHLSNGAWKKPNQGINQISMHVGLSYICKPDTQRLERQKYSGLAQHYWQVGLAGGFKQHEINTPRMGILSMHTYYVAQIKQRNSFFGGVDAMYDPGKSYWIDLYALPYSKGLEGYTQLALTGGYERRIHRTGISAQLGWYLYDPIRVNRKLYQRYSIQYHWSSRWSSFVALKAHSGTADWVEWGMVHRLSLRNAD
jgi:hypothetical protein